MAEEKDNLQQALPEETAAEEVAQTDLPEAGETTAQPEAGTAEVESLQAACAAKDQALKECEERVKRLQADFENFRRRTRQEKEELSAVVAQSLIKELLPLLDNFERALAADLGCDKDAVKSGIEMIYKQLLTTLERNGLEKIEAVGAKFDPNFHEAVMRVADEAQEEDTVLEELQRGYSVRGRVIRPSMVKVASR